MTPLQVEFCYQVALGNVQKAKALLPRMVGKDSLFEGTPRAPAVFCLWAAKQPNTQLPLDKLAELYPNISPPQIPTSTARVTPEETVTEVLVPVIQPHLHRLLFSIAHATPQEISTDVAKAGFETISCATALKYIRKLMSSDPAFKDITGKWDKLIGDMLAPLSPITHKGKLDEVTPDSVKALRTQIPAKSYLTMYGAQKRQKEVSKIVPKPHAVTKEPMTVADRAPDSIKALRKAAPSPMDRFSSLFSEIGKVSHQDNDHEIDQESIIPSKPKLGASKSYLTQYGAHPRARDLATHLHHISSNTMVPFQPPKMPDSLNQALSHPTLDLCATHFKPGKGH